MAAFPSLRHFQFEDSLMSARLACQRLVALRSLEPYGATRQRRSSIFWRMRRTPTLSPFVKSFSAINSRHLRVLNLVVEKADWNKPLADGRARGVAVHQSFRPMLLTSSKSRRRR